MASIQSTIVRLAFNNCQKPKADQKGDLKYSAMLLFPKDPATAYAALGLK